MVTPPASWELATPVFGIRYPKPTAPARYLPDAFSHIGGDLEAALLADGATPPGLNYRTGTSAQRLASPPIANQVWVESDTGSQYIGDGTKWIPIYSAVSDTGWLVCSPADSNWQIEPSSNGHRAMSYRKIGTMVLVNGFIRRITNPIQDGWSCTTLPAGFRPGRSPGREWLPSVSNDNLNGNQWYIDQAGVISVKNPQSATAGQGFIFNASFYIS